MERIFTIRIEAIFHSAFRHTMAQLLLSPLINGLSVLRQGGYFTPSLRLRQLAYTCFPVVAYANCGLRFLFIQLDIAAAD